MKRAYVTSAALIVVLVPSLFSQARRPAPPPKPPAKPFSWPTIPAPPKNSGGILGGVESKFAETAMSRVLNEQLPLKLDADAIYPTVATLPGGQFMPRPLQLTTADLDRPLPPGDYTIPIFAFCTEYSVHRPGYGVAYRLGPLQGKAAGAIAALLWRGMLEKNKPAQQLQAVSWAIQSGLRYTQMPKTYQAVIDQVIPDHRNELSGDFMQGLEDSYSAYAKSAHLPPIEQMLAKMGKSGELALSARKQRDALLRQNTTDQIREQTLFAGQETGVYRPVRAQEGPWTERISGVAYMRFQVNGGNMVGNNVMEIRIMPQGGAVARNHRAPRLVYARFPEGASVELAAYEPGPTPQQLLQNSIGCAVGLGAQCLVTIPAVKQPSCPPGQTYHPPQSLTALEKQPDHCTETTQSWDTGSSSLQVDTGQVRSRCGAIEFQVMCPDADATAHLVQFVSASVCMTHPPITCVPGNFNAERSQTCDQLHPYTVDPLQKQWSLDSLGPLGPSGLQDPYFDDGAGGPPRLGPGGLITGDQPSMTTNDPNADSQITAGNFRLTKTFTDFVVCGTQVIGEFKWTRFSSGGTTEYSVGKMTTPSAADLNAFRNLTREQGYGPW